MNMDLQSTFYLLGIILMTLMLVALIAIAVTVWIVKRKIDKMYSEVEKRIELVKELSFYPLKTIQDTGMLITGLFSGLKRWQKKIA